MSALSVSAGLGSPIIHESKTVQFAGYLAGDVPTEKGPMQDPGLNHRLQQRSRRSGLMIGLTMALTLAVCVGSFTMIYAQLEPVVSDFVSSSETEPPAAPTEIAQVAEPDDPEPEVSEPQPEPTAEPQSTTNEQPEPEPTDEPTPDEQDEDANNDEGEFVPDYQIDSPGPVNLRPGPGVNTGPAIIAVPVEAPLMYLGESEPTQNPAGDGLDQGQDWMLFRTEDGDEGWVREIDVTEYTP